MYTNTHTPIPVAAIETLFGFSGLGILGIAQDSGTLHLNLKAQAPEHGNIP